MSINIMVGVLLDLMRAEQKLKAQFLAEKYEVSVRTIYRYIDNLSAMGIPVATSPGRNGGIYLTNTYAIKSLFFTRDELNIMTDLLENSSDPLASVTLQKINFIIANQ